MEAFGQTTVEFDFAWPEALGQYTWEAELRGADGHPIKSVREVETIEAH